jgi:hypothetical protein
MKKAHTAFLVKYMIRTSGHLTYAISHAEDFCQAGQMGYSLNAVPCSIKINQTER